MPTQQEITNAGLLRLVTAVNTVDGKAASALAQIAGLPAPVVINDGATNSTETLSSQQIQTRITAALTALIGGAAANSDTLNELAGQITALAQADNGLLSFAGAQTLSAPQLAQAWANLQLGDPAHDYLPAINAALNAGL